MPTAALVDGVAKGEIVSIKTDLFTADVSTQGGDVVVRLAQDRVHLGLAVVAAGLEAAQQLEQHRHPRLALGRDLPKPRPVEEDPHRALVVGVVDALLRCGRRRPAHVAQQPVVERVDAPGGVGGGGDDADPLEPVHVVAHGGRAEAQGVGELAAGVGPIREQAEDAQAGGVRDGLQQVDAIIQLVRHASNVRSTSNKGSTQCGRTNSPITK